MGDCPAVHLLSRLRLTNIRGFRSLDLDLRESSGHPRRLTLLIGRNGTCKTSILRSIAIGLANFGDATTLLSDAFGGLVSNGEGKGEIFTSLADPLNLGSSYDFGREIYRSGDQESLEESQSEVSLLRFEFLRAGAQPQRFLYGYGAGRFGSGRSDDSSRTYRISDSVATLFRYDRPLLSPELTLRRLNDLLGPRSRFLPAMKGIQRVLGLDEGDEISFRPGGGVYVQSASVGGAIPLEAWADGYRLTLNWLLDLYGWAIRADAIDEDGQIYGILLIDEIEQHLHPSLQAEILPRLSALLPKMQIFATTHSPLVVLDAKPEEVVVLRREGPEIVAEQHIPDFRGYSAEDVLTDPRLLDSPDVSGSEKRLAQERYQALAMIPPDLRDTEQTAELRRLANSLHDQPSPSARESEVVRELRALVAKGHL